MKNICKSIPLLLLPFVSSCTSDELFQELVNVGDEEITKVTAILPDWNQESVNSRTSITTGRYPTAPSPVWVTGDSIGIYPDAGGDQLSFRINEGGSKTCTFDGGGWAMKSSSYTAYSPFQRSYYYKKKEALPISMLGQKQIGNDNADHLGAYDIQIAKGEKPETGSLVFGFSRKVALVRMEIDAPRAATWTSVALESDALFTTEAKMNISLVTPNVTSVSTANSMTLGLSDVTTTAENTEIIAYMMLLPVDLTNKALVVKLADNEGNVYISKASVTNDKTNFTSNSARWITASDFKLYEKPDYSWYSSSQLYSYRIATAGQFMAFAKLVNGDEDALEATGSSVAVNFSGKTIFLSNDIDLSAYCGEGLGSWKPISGFAGTFDGLDKTIDNLYCNHAGDMGLFSGLSQATVKNLKVQGKIEREFENDPNLAIGGIASSADRTVFENCISHVDITTSGTKNTSPISCSIGGVCGYASSSTFIACLSTSVISDNHSPIEWGYYIGGIVGRVHSNSNLLACAKLDGDVKEMNWGSYSFVGGIIGWSSESSYSYPNNRLRACYTAINVQGRRPGLIVGATADGSGHNYPLNASACYYSGTGNSMGSGETLGVGNNYYGGQEVSYDSGTLRTTDLNAAVNAMNTAITIWNSENPSQKCNYTYINGSNGVELVKSK